MKNSWPAIVVMTFGCGAAPQRALFAEEPRPAERAASAPRIVREIRITTDGSMKHRPVWSPDGSQMVFARHLQDRIQLFVRELASGKERRLTNREPPEYDADWSPDGKRIAFSQLTLYGTQGDVDLAAVNADGSAHAVLAKTEGGLSHEEWPSWSPDGKRIAFTSTRYGNQEIAVIDADGKNERRLTSDNTTDAHPCWSPDGKSIVFASDRWSGRELALIDADGKNVRRLTTSPGFDDYPSWSPDGKWIAFVSNRDGNFEIYLIRLDGSKTTNLTKSPSRDAFPRWRPDGKAIAFVSTREGKTDVFVGELNDGTRSAQE